jgi:hypothetical protein
MLQAQKMANDNFEATKKVMHDVPPPAPVVSAPSGMMSGGIMPVKAEVVSGFGGKEAPEQPPHPEK